MGGQDHLCRGFREKKIGLEDLLEMILLQAEVLELKANPTRPMLGTIVEAKLDRGRGPVATVLVQQGTLRVGDIFVTGAHFGKVRALINDKGKKVDQAGPSIPVEVIGLDGVPLAGDTFVVVADERTAKEVAQGRSQRQRLAELSQTRRVTLDDLYQEIQEGTVKELNIIVKADVQGSAEAIKESLEKLTSPLVKLRVIHRGVGSITESDILLASASNAIVIGFNVRPETKGEDLAERENVDIRLYTIIYDAIADVKAAMEGLLEPTLKERTLGRVEVRQVFQIPKQGVIAGGHVSSGLISRNSAGARVIRDGTVVYEGKIGSLRRFKDDVKEVQAGYECGIGIENFNDIKVGDVIEVYTHDKIAAKL
ncbi:MAG: translation initiation factor IF-2 [Candidatus Manganitrophus sp.]|nr:MAG: translation initiation factor IF-2 [Candidatus Manganitrophus sp.]